MTMSEPDLVAEPLFDEPNVVVAGSESGWAKRRSLTLADLIGDLKVFPQTIQNIRVREKIPFAQVPEIQRTIEAAEKELDGNGRVVVRYSGTEALARVMVEAESEEKMKTLAGNIAGAIKSVLGV